MSAILTRVFTPLTPNDQTVLSEANSLLLRTNFRLMEMPGFEEEIQLGLTNNYILASRISQGQEINCYCELSFEIKFEVLRRQWEDDKNPGVPFGIRFQKGSANQSIEIFHNNPGQIQQWVSFLSKKINQRNFHQLFKAKKKIGKGAFATVYLAERLTDKKMVAVKAFSKEKQYSGDKGKQSLQNEIKIMRGVDHHNIMKLEQVYQTQNSIYVILECLEGKQFNQQLKNKRVFNTVDSLVIIKQILSGLEHLSQRRVIHRDLKPQNIMFKTEDSLQISICDFGLATYADEEKYLFVRCGTPGFVAPEIINIKDLSTKSDPISDVFSAGIILHILLTGESVFPGRKYNEVLAQNRSCDFNFHKPMYESIEPSILDLLMHMLEKNPSKRITPTIALQHPCFLQTSNVMEMDQQEHSGQERKVFREINFLPVQGVKNTIKQTSYEDEMVDQNQPKKTHSIGESVKKKLSFMVDNNKNLKPLLKRVI